MHWKIIAALALVGGMQLALMTPAASGDPVTQTVSMGDRFVARPAGVEKDMTLFFGPYVIPPGQDRNLVTPDLPFYNGFVTQIAPNLVDATTGLEPSDLEMHIHHAHWFRLSNDPSDEYYTLNLAWVFGTGEEKTQGSLDARAAADPAGFRYGIYIPGGQPQAMIFMLHNKGSTEKTMYITLSVHWIYGSHDEIKAATGCGLVLLAGETCAAGQDFHEVKGRLWGNTFDVPRNFVDPNSVYVYPRDITTNDPKEAQQNALGSYFVAPYDGTAIASAGHIHPNGEKVVVVNLGPAGSGCEADLDGDGYPGVTLFHSDKINRYPMAGAQSEEYQLGATQFDWRAPIHAGDRISQFGVYQNGKYASYEAMSYVGIYVDREQAPPPLPAGACDANALKPVLLNHPGADPTVTILNHAWETRALPYCGFGSWPACDKPVTPQPAGAITDTIHISAFTYVPGDQNTDLGTGVPQVVQGTPLTVVNDDVSLGVRHSLTTCAYPCNGPYVANYPQDDGVLETGNLGNFDYINGGFGVSQAPPFFEPGRDMLPVTKLDTSHLTPGHYAFFCRIHPWMRGSLDVVAPS